MRGLALQQRLLIEEPRHAALGLVRRAEQGLVLWHLCSLDAPSIAVVWAVALFHVAGMRARPAELAVLAGGTWMVYVLDRILDAAAAREGAALAERHHFHHRHRRPLLWLCAAAAVGLAACCAALTPNLLRFYLLLGLPVGAYAVVVHGRLKPDGGPELGLSDAQKGTAVAVLFTAAVAAPALVEAAASARSAVLAAAAFLAMLCWVNCAVISATDDPDHNGLGLLFWLASSTVLANGVWYAHGLRLHARSNLFAAALLVSALLLFALVLSAADHRRVLGRRVAADLALLTPLLLWLPRS